MRKIDVVVLIEKTCQMYVLDIARVEQAGLSGIFTMFKEVADLHEIAKNIVGDTFRFRLGNEMVDTFTEQVEGILNSKEAENNFKSFAIGLNPGMAEEIGMELRLSVAAQLAKLNLDMVLKMIKVGETGVDMRDLFDDDYIYICIRQLCGFYMQDKYVEFLGDPDMTQTEFFQELVECSEVRVRG
ncbi:hypothetical protein ACWA2C_28080 [Priestia megaterium]